jgi:uncharacterized coiled-coil protein SlyX
VAPTNQKRHEADECAVKVVACRAADIGCEFTSPRGCMQEHEEKCAVWPLRNILQHQQDTMQRLSRLIEEQQTMLKQQQGEIDELNKDMQALKTQAEVNSGPFSTGAPSATAPTAALTRGGSALSVERSATREAAVVILDVGASMAAQQQPRSSFLVRTLPPQRNQLIVSLNLVSYLLCSGWRRLHWAPPSPRHQDWNRR